jgi:ketosteroid isomerase-like protein
MARDFAEFLQAREQASAAYIEGDTAPLAAIASHDERASFMPPSGALVTGAEEVTQAFVEGAKQFRKGSRGRFEVIQSGSAGDLGFWTGLHYAQMSIQGCSRPPGYRTFSFVDAGGSAPRCQWLPGAAE